ncbi:PH domain-containing protein [Tirmania nivea]|nr:PH domain-containing protein [Tirmania nivea]
MTLKEALHLPGHHHAKNIDNTTASQVVSPASPTNKHEVERTDTMSSTEAIPKGATPDTASTLEERLKAWKHMVGRLEDYMEQHESLYKAMGREYEKVGKKIEDPLKESEMFTQTAGGISSLFENMRTNTSTLAASHHETAKSIKSGIIPQLERLHVEIKAKAKELNQGATKGTKAVTKSREQTQKYIDQLAKNVGRFDSVGGAGTKLTDPMEDPYIIKRRVFNKLHNQVGDENAQRQDLLAVQMGFQAFEAHVIQTVQGALNAFYQVVGAQADRTRGLYGDIISTAGRVPLDMEWNAFVQKYEDALINPVSPNRDVASLTFPNQHHSSTKSSIEGSLQRKGKILGRYNTAYYVVTSSKYLHEFENADHNTKDPEPQMSLYLPECKIGALTAAPDAKFTLSGKDANKNQKLTREHDFVFKASTHQEAAKWWDAISKASGIRTAELPSPTPAATRENSLATAPPPYEEKEKGNLKLDTQAGTPGAGIVTGGSVVQSPVAQTPVTPAKGDR